VDFEHGLNFCIRQIRTALSDDAETPRYIETLPRRGYRFIGAVNAALRHKTASPEKRFVRAALTRPLFWAMLLVVVAMFSLGIYVRGRPHKPTPGAGKLMLAVLPFENLSGNREQEYFSDGLTEEMIAELSRFNPERFRVIARTSAMHYKGAALTAAQIGHELGVDYILESSVRREGTRVRITTQLVRVSDQTHIWSQSYEREAQGLLALQKDVANDVAMQIALKLNPGSAKPSAGIPSLDAHEAYLKGRFFWNKRSEQGHLKAIEYFEQAIAGDPGYAQAYSGLADAYALLGSNPTTAITRHEAMAKARAAALKALEMDDTLAEAHTSRLSTTIMTGIGLPRRKNSSARCN